MINTLVLMENKFDNSWKKYFFLLWAGWVASYLQRFSSVQVNGGGVQMPHLTDDTAIFRSGSQEAALVMWYESNKEEIN